MSINFIGMKTIAQNYGLGTVESSLIWNGKTEIIFKSF